MGEKTKEENPLPKGKRQLISGGEKADKGKMGPSAPS